MCRAPGKRRGGARLFEAFGDHGSASCLDYSGTDKEVAAAERGIAHAFSIAFEIVRLGMKEFSGFGVSRGKRAQLLDERFDFSLVELVLQLTGATLLPAFIGGEQLAGETPEVLTGMVKIDDLN